MKKLILSIAMVLILVNVSNAATYYVRTDGNNNCNGLYDAAGSSGNCAFATVTKAESVLTTGSAHIVNIAAGSYNENVTCNVSGLDSTHMIEFVGNGTVWINRFYFGATSSGSGSANYVKLYNLRFGIQDTPVNQGSEGLVHANPTSSYYVIDSCYFDGQNKQYLNGLNMWGDHGTVSNSTFTRFYDTWVIQAGQAGASAPGTNYLTITGNTVTGNNSCDFINLHGSNVTISQNEFGNNTYTGSNHPDFIQWYPNDNGCSTSYSIQHILLERNWVHDSIIQPYYGQNDCYPTSTVDDITFRNNIFSNLYYVGQLENAGSLVQTNINFYNNIFYKVGYGGSDAHPINAGSACTGEIKNNVFLESGPNPASTANGWYASVSNFTISNNYVGGTAYAAKSGFSESGGINGGNPNFVNKGTDWNLASNSFLKDAGATISSFSNDYLGNTRTGTWDIGAYEYGAGTSTLSIPAGVTISGATVQ
jgi:hypothetical protein